MRMYALYERSRKVLTLCIVVAAVILVVTCVSLNLNGNNDLPSHYTADSVVYSGYTPRRLVERNAKGAECA